MRHNYIKDDASGDHWSVGVNSTFKNILVQIQVDGQQVRIALDQDHAKRMTDCIQKYLQDLKNLDKIS